MIAHFRHHQHRAAGLALWVLLLGLLLPVLASANASAAQPQWLEVCTTHGVELVMVQEAEPDAPPAQALVGGHCLYCFLNDEDGAVVALPAPQALALAAWRPRAAQPLPAYRAKPLAAARQRAPQPRAPPLAA